MGTSLGSEGPLVVAGGASFAAARAGCCCSAGELLGAGSAVWVALARRSDLPRAFRTADLRLIHTAICCSRYSSWTCCGVRYWSPECRRLELYQNSMYLTTSRYA